MPVLEGIIRIEASGCGRAKGSPAALLSGRLACGGGGGGLGGKKAASRGAAWDALSFVWIVTPPLIVTTGSTCTCHQPECSICKSCSLARKLTSSMRLHRIWIPQSIGLGYEVTVSDSLHS